MQNNPQLWHLVVYPHQQNAAPPTKKNVSERLFAFDWHLLLFIVERRLVINQRGHMLSAVSTQIALIWTAPVGPAWSLTPLPFSATQHTSAPPPQPHPLSTTLPSPSSPVRLFIDSKKWRGETTPGTMPEIQRLNLRTSPICGSLREGRGRSGGCVFFEGEGHPRRGGQMKTRGSADVTCLNVAIDLAFSHSEHQSLNVAIIAFARQCVDPPHRSEGISMKGY